MAYLNAITKTIKQIQDSDEDTRDRYNYHRGLSLHMIKKLMGADHSQWGYINNALKSGINKGKLIKTGGKYRVAVTKKKSRKLRKCKYGRDRTTGKCRKRRSVKRKTSRKRRSVKRKTSRKRRSVKRKTSRKRRSVKRKVSRKRRSVKRKGNVKSTKRKSRKMKSMKSRQSPPSGVIKKENLKPGTIRVGADGKTKYEVYEYVSRGKKIKKWKKYVPLYLKFRMRLKPWTADGGADDWDDMYSDDEGGEGGETKSPSSMVSSPSISPSMARLPPEIITYILNYDHRKRGDLHPAGNLDGPNSLQMKNLRERMSRFKAFQRLVKSNQLVQVALPGKGVHYFTNQYGQPSHSNTSAYPPLGTVQKAQERGGYELNSRISGDPADFALMMEYILDIIGSNRQIFNGVSSRSGEHLTPQQKQEVRRLLSIAYTHKEQGFDDRHLFGDGYMAKTSKIKNKEERKAHRRQILNHPVNGYGRINGHLLPLPLKIFRRGRTYGVVPSDRYPTTDQRPVAPDGSNVDEAHDIFWPETRAQVRRFLHRKPSLRELFSRVNPGLFH